MMSYVLTYDMTVKTHHIAHAYLGIGRYLPAGNFFHEWGMNPASTLPELTKFLFTPLIPRATYLLVLTAHSARRLLSEECPSVCYKDA